ncbi:MAG TPA: bi-domain-containing oxidoreductase [Nitrososphaerales archaeon]|nr:bi-domain-containing oxidoreductase [Nitrososphaerales archaeon]
MKQVVAKAGKVEVVEVPRPVCPDNGLLVRTEYSVISTGTESWAIGSTEPIGTSDLASDSAMLSKAYRLSKDVLRTEGVAGLRDYVDAVRHPQLPLGYSSSGVVLELGREVTDMIVGQRVACAGEGKASHSEYQSVPRKLVGRVPEGLSTKEAAFSTVGAIALHAVRTAGLQIGETVGVIGVGLVGNLVAQISRASGCRVVSIDLRDDRLELAKELAARLAVRADDPSLSSHILNFTGGVGLDHVFVCAASTGNESINMAARLARSRGQVIVVGRVGMEVERQDFYQKELKLLMTRSLGPGRYDPVYEEKGVDYPIEYVRWTLNRNMEAFMDLARSGEVKVDKLIGGEYPLAQAAEAYESLQSQAMMTALLRYESAQPVLQMPQATESSTATRKSGAIQVALVGPGAFAKETMIPLLRSSTDFNLRWLVSSSPLHAKQLERRYNFGGSTCDYKEVLSDKDVGLVVITAPNHLHFEMLSSALLAGKLALVEKPLCITREEFDKVKRIQEETKLPIIVGFNRRYAPLALEMKKRMKVMDGPFVVTYRVNAGFVPSNKWSQDPSQGGGRIIHECCHFFDFFNFLLGSNEPRISVGAAGITGANSVARDNISVTLEYPDGSLANLVYVAMGSKVMDRERVEVYGGKSSMVLDDFKELSFYAGAKDSIKLQRADKGHATELKEVAKLIHGRQSSIISTEEVFRATELTFRVDEAVRGRGE